MCAEYTDEDCVIGLIFWLGISSFAGGGGRGNESFLITKGRENDPMVLDTVSGLTSNAGSRAGIALMADANSLEYGFGGFQSLEGMTNGETVPVSCGTGGILPQLPV